MTCVGLLGLAVGRGSGKEIAAVEDEAITQGLRALANLMKNSSDNQGFMKVESTLGPKDALNYYFLWSVERVGVLLNLKTIGGKDWYRWGVDLILPEQKKDGSWVGRGSGGSPVIDTCFALLFLKKSDLLPDLRETLQKRLKIVDPGASPGDKSENPKKDPGEPREKSDEPKKKPELPKALPKKDTPRQEAHHRTMWFDSYERTVASLVLIGKDSNASSLSRRPTPA
jgi:hypothetical protein